MILEVYLFFLVLTIGLFITSFFTHQILLWVLSIVASGVMIVQSYSIEYYVYQYNASIYLYSPVAVQLSYPYLSMFCIGLLGLGLVLLFYDIFNPSGIVHDNKNEN